MKKQYHLLNYNLDEDLGNTNSHSKIDFPSLEKNQYLCQMNDITNSMCVYTYIQGRSRRYPAM